MHPPFYTDIDKLAHASNNNNNNNNSYQIFGNKQGACNSCNSHALGSHSKHSAINSDINTGRCHNDSTSSNNNIENIHTSSTPQILDDINNTSNGCYSIPAQFSTSVKANKAEDDLVDIRCCLISQCTPPDLSSNAITCFISRTCYFLISGGWLWWRQIDSQHQLYASYLQHYALVHDVHDKLGHKGFYSTCCTLLDCFWWPLLESDVKWYVQTCHKCQICQTTHIHLLLTVDTPTLLFCKVYIDTMFMPHMGGYMLRSKGLKDMMCVVWFGDNWDFSVGNPPESMFTWVGQYWLPTQYNK